MMNCLKIVLPLTALLCLGACTPVSPASEPNPTPPNAPLQAVTPENPPTATPESEAETGSASPAEVDLSQLTPQSPAEASPQVAPRPGVPDPKAALAHVVSQDLAARLGRDVSEVQLVSAKEMEWGDSSLGCPAPDMAYASVITPGYLITLALADESYKYHTDLEGNFVLCSEDGRPFTP